MILIMQETSHSALQGKYVALGMRSVSTGAVNGPLIVVDGSASGGSLSPVQGKLLMHIVTRSRRAVKGCSRVSQLESTEASAAVNRDDNFINLLRQGWKNGEVGRPMVRHAVLSGRA